MPVPLSCLQEPAILLDIFNEFPQRDLLLAQRVCRTWRSTIASNKSLLIRLYLYPHRSDDSDVAPTLNPLLVQRFPTFFCNNLVLNKHSRGGNNLGPWEGSTMLANGRGQWLADPPNPAYMHADASWRKMLPCLPAPTKFQLHMGVAESGNLWCLDFSNKADTDEKGHDWLTFGLIYDLVESAWFRGDPHVVYGYTIDLSFSAASKSHAEDNRRLKASLRPTQASWSRVPLQARYSSEHISGPSCICIDLRIDERTEEQKKRERRQGRAQLQKQRARLQPFDDLTITDEFRVVDATSMAEIDWSRTYNYGRLPTKPSTQHTSELSRVGRLAANFRRWRNPPQ